MFGVFLLQHNSSSAVKNSIVATCSVFYFRPCVYISLFFYHFEQGNNPDHPDMSVSPTDVRVEDLLHHQLEELFGNASFVDALLSLELDVELLLQVGRVLHGDHLQLGDTGGRGKGVSWGHVR